MQREWPYSRSAGQAIYIAGQVCVLLKCGEVWVHQQLAYESVVSCYAVVKNNMAGYCRTVYMGKA